MTTPEVPSGITQHFRNRLLHVAIEMKLFSVTEALLIAGAQVDVYLAKHL
jgi:hypothetical protein